MTDEKKTKKNQISDDVIAVCASNAALQVQGVSSMDNIPAKNRIASQPPVKGVKVSYDNKRLVLDLYINVEYGCKIPEVSWNLQENVKNTVEDLAEIKVYKVNIHVQGVDFNNE